MRVIPSALNDIASLLCCPFFLSVCTFILLYPTSVAILPADTDEEMNGTLDQNETVHYHYHIPVAGITLRVCISVGHVVVYGSFSVPNPNSAFYDFVLEFGSESNTSDTETCRNRYIDPDKIPQPHPPPNTQPSSTYQPSTGGAPTTTTTLAPQPTVVPSTSPPVVGLTDKVVYLSVVGRAEDNNFVLNGSVGDSYPKPSSAIISGALPPTTSSLRVAPVSSSTPPATVPPSVSSISTTLTLMLMQ